MSNIPEKTESESSSYRAERGTTTPVAEGDPVGKWSQHIKDQHKFDNPIVPDLAAFQTCEQVICCRAVSYYLGAAVTVSRAFS